MRNRILMGLAFVAMVVVVGVLFGLWLSWNAPVDRAAEAPVPVAQGRPGEAPVAAVDQETYLPEPPQPRVDGSRGVPSRPVQPSAPIPLVSAADQPQPDTLLSTIAPDMQTVNPGSPLPAHLAEPPAAAQSPRIIVEPPSQQVATVVAGADAAGGQEPWIQSLRAELARCASQGVVGRVICNEKARWKYCNTDNRWGRIAECPATGNN
ncbi:hypothetical protein N5K27_13750 [Pigmentiphaga sp. GD03639]|uniref:Uncharacterized protein n=1 Tax=Pigmentiphaga daeguensis TaxID=414049 RepID=A0ABP3MB28_9BURK|nr:MULTISPECIES: hypothetical protein [unclassified Pigmentiphaga]MDH2237362.1 hypothetical protein [Pigmentiphaga sp. GD03639]